MEGSSQYFTVAHPIVTHYNTNKKGAQIIISNSIIYHSFAVGGISESGHLTVGAISRLRLVKQNGKNRT